MFGYEYDVVFSFDTEVRIVVTVTLGEPNGALAIERAHTVLSERGVVLDYRDVYETGVKCTGVYGGLSEEAI